MRGSCTWKVRQLRDQQPQKAVPWTTGDVEPLTARSPQLVPDRTPLSADDMTFCTHPPLMTWPLNTSPQRLMLLRASWRASAVRHAYSPLIFRPTQCHSQPRRNGIITPDGRRRLRHRLVAAEDLLLITFLLFVLRGAGAGRARGRTGRSRPAVTVTVKTRPSSNKQTVSFKLQLTTVV